MFLRRFFSMRKPILTGGCFHLLRGKICMIHSDHTHDRNGQSRKEVKEMIAVIYASLIIKGRKKFSDVPASIREQVNQNLIDLDCAELAE